MGKSYAYLRGARLPNQDGFSSIEGQEKSIGDYCSRRKLLISAWYRDIDTQGETQLSKRRSGAELIARLKAGDTVICASPGRMFGKASDASETIRRWNELDIEIHFVSLGGAISGKSLDMLLSFLTSLGEEEERLRGERISRTKKALAGEGKFPGGRIPFGYIQSEDGKIGFDYSKKDAFLFILTSSSDGQSNRWISQELRKRYDISLSYNGVKRTIERSKDDTELWKILKNL